VSELHGEPQVLPDRLGAIAQTAASASTESGTSSERFTSSPVPIVGFPHTEMAAHALIDSVA